MKTAIIVAAGSGSRFGGDIPKQYRNLAGKPVIEHTLDKFEQCAAIDAIVLVLNRDSFELGESISRRFGKVLKVVTGGATRAQSVMNGIAVVDENTQVCAVHDGVRPLVNDIEIEAVIKAATRFGAACLVGKITDTIKSIDGNRILETVDRDGLRAALTPQAFEFGLLQAAFENVDLNEATTDECKLIEATGAKIVLVDGNPANLKITQEEDLIIAEALISNGYA